MQHRLQVSILYCHGNTPLTHLYQYRFGCLEILSPSCGVHYQNQSLCSLADSLSCQVLLEIINCFGTQLSTALHTKEDCEAAHALTSIQRHQQCKWPAVMLTRAVPKVLKVHAKKSTKMLAEQQHCTLMCICANGFQSSWNYPEVSDADRIVSGMAETALPCDVVSLHLHKHQE